MTKKYPALILALIPSLIAAVLTACAAVPLHLPTFETWSVSEGMAAPESAHVDPGTGSLFVSQVVLKPEGTPTDKDGNGRIAKLSTDGRLLDANWVTGLHSPKGLRSHHGTLWVSDVDEVIAIDIASATIVRRIPIPGAKFLNDVAISPQGTVYVSDMVTNKIHQIKDKDDQASILAEGEVLGYPNGLLYQNGGLIVAAWGRVSTIDAPAKLGHLYRLDLTTRLLTPITSEPIGHLDGLESDGHGGYIVSDWMAGKILHVEGNGQTRLLRQLKRGTADIAYLPERHMLIVPHMLDNRTVAYDLRASLPLFPRGDR